MLAVLQWIYGPSAESDPYYLLLHDFVVLMPDWYGYMWLGIITSVVSWRLMRRWRLRRQSRVGLRRVRSRVLHLAETPDRGLWLPLAANDDQPAAVGRHLAAE